MAETRAHDDRHVGPDGEDFFRKLDPRHLRHGLVGNDEIESGRVEPEEGKGFSAAGLGLHPIAKSGQYLLPHHGECLLVVRGEWR